MTLPETTLPETTLPGTTLPGTTLPETTSAPALTPMALAAHIDGLNLAGLSFAAKRMLGKDAARVTSQFTMWARQELDALPSLTADLWTALAPLGTGRPDLQEAVVCDKVLRGRWGDAEVSADAAAECGRVAKDWVAKAPLPAVDAAEGALRRKALVKSVKDYWRALGNVYEAVNARVVTGEHPRAERMALKAQTALLEIVERIESLATAVAELAPAVGGSSPHDAALHDDDMVVQRSPRSVGALPGERQEVEARAVAFAQSRQMRAEPVREPLPVEVLSTKPVRNRVFAPVVFLLIVAGVALFVIFSVLNAPNPLTQ